MDNDLFDQGIQKFCGQFLGNADLFDQFDPLLRFLHLSSLLWFFTVCDELSVFFVEFFLPLLLRPILSFCDPILSPVEQMIKLIVSFVLLGLGKALPNKFLTETEEANAEIRATGRYLL